MEEENKKGKLKEKIEIGHVFYDLQERHQYFLSNLCVCVKNA